MKKVIELFTDPIWVFSSVVLAFFMSFLAAIAKDRYDEFSTRLFSAARKKKEQKKAATNQMAAALTGRVEERMHLQFMQVKVGFRGSVFGALGSIVLGLGLASAATGSRTTGVAGSILGACLLVVTFRDFRIYNLLEDVLVLSLQGSDFWIQAKQTNKAPEPTATTATTPAAQEPSGP